MHAQHSFADVGSESNCCFSDLHDFEHGVFLDEEGVEHGCQISNYNS